MFICINNNVYMHKYPPKIRIMSEIFEIWPYFLLFGLVLGMKLKGQGKLFVIWLWFSAAITYILRADILFFVVLVFNWHDFKGPW